MDSEDLQFREVFPLIMAALAGLLALFLVAALITGSHLEKTYIPSGQTKLEVASQRLAPVGKVNMGGPVVAKAEGGSSGADQASSKPRSGEETYKAVCSACHANGTLGAPKFGDTADWKPRAKQSLDKLAHQALNGFKKMPPQKSAAKLEEIKRAVKFMLDKANLKAGS